MAGPPPFAGALTITRGQHLEGVVCKRLDRPYEPGRRSRAWLKYKHYRSETFAVTGWAPKRTGADELDTFYVGCLGPDGDMRPAGASQPRARQR